MATLRLTRSANAQMTPNEAMIQSTVPQGGTKNLDSVVPCTTEAVDLSSCELLGGDEMVKLIVVLLPSVMLLLSTRSPYDDITPGHPFLASIG